MKRLLLISTIFTTMSAFAQTQCSTSNPLFMFDNSSAPKDIERLGSAPEFPFLRNMSSARQVAAAIRRNEEKNTAGMSQFNDMMVAIGFPNGAKDVNESNISMYYVPYGTEGNMGSAGYTNIFCTLKGSPEGNKAWKISSGNGCYMYVMAKCGNAFYPKTQKRTACISNVPVNLTGEMKEVTLNSSGQKTTTTSNIYVYYEQKRHKKHAMAHPIEGISDPYPSAPLLLNSSSDVEAVPETYKVTLSTPDNTVNVCPDSALNLTANINVEKTSEYTGYYPQPKNEYRRVSKHSYKVAARKMRKARRKEAKVARRTGVTVSECAVASK